MVILGPIALFSNIELTTSSGKHLEDFSHTHTVSSMYKTISGAEDTNDLSIGFDQSPNRRRDKLTSNKNMKVKYHPRIMLKEVFGFVECMDEATYGRSYKITLTGNKDDDVTDKAARIADARIKIDYIHWYLSHCIPSIQRQDIKSKQILSRTPTEFKHIERSVFMKEATIQNLWNFELASQERMKAPICIIKRLSTKR